jgi:peptidoglycan/LPS O-acetylase OafA/YrhL
LGAKTRIINMSYSIATLLTRNLHDVFGENDPARRRAAIPQCAKTQKQMHLEAIRGLAALCVVAAHYAAAFYPSAVFGASYRLHENWERLFTTTPLGLIFSGYFAVCLFFVLSGYVLSIPYFGPSAKDTDHLLAALFKRPFRLGGLVVVSILISFCLLRSGGYFNVAVSDQSFSTPWFHDYWPQGVIGLKRLVGDLSTHLFACGAAYNSPLWTLQIELYGSFLVFIFLLLFRKTKLRALAYLYAAVCFRGSLYHGFVIGILFADIVRNYGDSLKVWSRHFISWPLLAFGLIAASYPAYSSRADLTSTFYGFFPQLPFLGGGYSMLGAVLVFGAVLLAPRLQFILSTPLFAFLGRISYAVYAVHFLLLGSFSSWLFLTLRHGLSYGASFLVVVLCSLSLLLVISYYLTKYVDEPITQAANRLAQFVQGKLASVRRKPIVIARFLFSAPSRDAQPLAEVAAARSDLRRDIRD